MRHIYIYILALFKYLSSIFQIYVRYILVNIYIYIYTLSAGTHSRWSRKNPNFAETQTSNKRKLQTNPNFEQTQTSNKSKLRTNPNFEQTQKFLDLGGLIIIRPPPPPSPSRFLIRWRRNLFII